MQSRKLTMTIDGQKVPVNWGSDRLPTVAEAEEIEAAWRARQGKAAHQQRMKPKQGSMLSPARLIGMDDPVQTSTHHILPKDKMPRPYQQVLDEARRYHNQGKAVPPALAKELEASAQASDIPRIKVGEPAYFNPKDIHKAAKGLGESAGNIFYNVSGSVIGTPPSLGARQTVANLVEDVAGTAAQPIEALQGDPYAIAGFAAPGVFKAAKGYAKGFFKTLDEALESGISGGAKALEETPKGVKPVVPKTKVPKVPIKTAPVANPPITKTKPVPKPAELEKAGGATGLANDAQVPKPQKTSAVAAKQGISHAEIDVVRDQLGWEPRTRDPKADVELFKQAKAHQGKEPAIAERVLADTEKKLSDSEGLALGGKLLKLKEEMTAAKKANHVEAYDLADIEAQRIADALDAAGSQQGRNLRSRRFLAKDFDSWEFKRGTQKANLDQPLSGKKAQVLEMQAKLLDESNAQLRKERDAAVKSYELLLGANQSKRSRGPLNATQRRNAALTSLRRLGVPVAEHAPTTAGGGIKSKQAGAINIPAGSTEQVAQGVRALVRTYAEDGAQDWAGVMQRLQRDLPGIEEDQALFILSGKYKTRKIEADVARSKAMAFQNEVKRDAEFRMKPIAAKLGDLGMQIGNTTQRTLQTTLDNSLALIQNKNALMWKPGTWFKGVGKSLQAMAQKDPINFARKEMSTIENDPLYAKAKQAKLALSEVDGPLNRQEEAMAGMIENHIPGFSHSKAMATVLGNTIRFDLFRKLAAQAPKNAGAAYYSDIARQINIITGKGTGRVAEMLGTREAGLVSYAPRYYLSKWQHILGVPIIKAETAAGRAQAAKMYATQFAFYTAAIVTAEQVFGFKVDLDPRSSTFGVATAKDGSYSFDLFAKQAEPVRVLAQLIYGRVSKKGNYAEPGLFGAFSPGDYIESKLSPLGRTIMMGSTGQTYDMMTDKRRKTQWADYWQSFIPLSIKEMYKNKDKPGTFPASFMGAGIDKPVQKTSKPPPLKLWPPPGLKHLVGQ